ncbi:arylamine N-acetyltransferase family protein [Saccharopolyspora hordei]|uniref:Amide synthase n=1 Tax=Saccharopolyspora hordei TaxID=1838 RepID=A0A853ARU5_9PSEU|nr:arylamine N-acetyltransferase [Saccharopolyspora hordei]NYI84321.1 amide synthase [Saccharopolyspora hordei]
MFDVDQYLKAIGFSGHPQPDVATLRRLHKAHLMAIPYDSSWNAERGISIWRDVDIDVDTVFDEIVVGGRGGNCYELNGLFRRLLDEIGYDTAVLSAGIRQVDGTFGPDLEHVFNRVELDGTTWLVDVGFVGPSYLEPLVLSDDEQPQFGSTFRITRQDGYRVLERKGQAGDWQSVYRFRPQARDFQEWSGDQRELIEFAQQLVGAGTVIRGRAFDTGQMILIGRRYLEVDNGHDRMRVLVDQDELDRVVRTILRTDR